MPVIRIPTTVAYIVTDERLTLSFDGGDLYEEIMMCESDQGQRSLRRSNKNINGDVTVR